MIYLAFYKGRKTWVDRLICWATRSQYSHCEITTANLSGKCGMAVSSSGRDGGVRIKEIQFNPEHWDFLPVTWEKDIGRVLRIANAERGKKYDFNGLFLSQVLNLRRQNQSKWFCSELCAHALGLTRASQFSPGDLHLEILERNTLIQRFQNSSGVLDEFSPQQGFSN